MMQFASIASGSSGNCLYAGNDDTHILIDTGISKKRIDEGLKAFGIEGSHIDAVFITHEHSDHIKGLGVFSRKYHVPIYATLGTLKAVRSCRSLGALDDGLFNIIRPGEPVKIGSLSVNPFSVPHDARDPVSYRVDDESRPDGASIGCAADLGYYNDSIIQAMKDCDLLYIEANHDMRMLQTGPYPYQLKMRIAGNYGHLCNEDGGQLAGRLLNERLKTIVLGHLSQENNYPDLALAAVKGELERDYSYNDKDIDIIVASRDIHMERTIVV